MDWKDPMNESDLVLCLLLPEAQDLWKSNATCENNTTVQQASLWKEKDSYFYEYGSRPHKVSRKCCGLFFQSHNKLFTNLAFKVLK